MEKDFRLLMIGTPGCPIFEVGERLSTFYALDYFTIENTPVEEDSFFVDKIPSVHLDTNDFRSGSGSASGPRDISSAEQDEDLDSLFVPRAQNELTEEELSEVLGERCGILSTEIPDIRLLEWASHVCYLRADFDAAIEWFSKRRKCITCGNVHHLEDKPSAISGVCDRCGSYLIIQDCDKPENVFAVYRDWRTIFNVFERKCKTKHDWKIVDVDKCESFDAIVDKVADWMRRTGFKGIENALPTKLDL